MANPTLDPDTYSSELVEETILPGIESHLDANFDDPQDPRDGDPPLVVSTLPDSGSTAYPHVVVNEASDEATRRDRRSDLWQHEFATAVAIHGQSASQAFALRDLCRGWLLQNWNALDDAGLAQYDVSGSEPDDDGSGSADWELTVSGLVHTHPNTA